MNGKWRVAILLLSVMSYGCSSGYYQEFGGCMSYGYDAPCAPQAIVNQGDPTWGTDDIQSAAMEPPYYHQELSPSQVETATWNQLWW